MSSQRIEGKIDSFISSMTYTHTTASVGTTSVTVLAQNEDRKYANIINDSDTVVYLYVDGTAVANKGVRINASGGNFEMYLGKNLSKGTVSAITSAAGKNLLVIEGE